MAAGLYGIDYDQQTIPLDAYVGQTVYIAFVRVNNQTALTPQGDRWLIDNVSVGGSNLISGSVHYAADGNCTANSPVLPMTIPIAATFGSNPSYVFTSDQGHYTYTSLNNTITLTPHPVLGNYFTVTPGNYNFNFPGLGNTATADYCIVPNGIHNDLEVVLVPHYDAIPGYNNYYNIVYKTKEIRFTPAQLLFNSMTRWWTVWIQIPPLIRNRLGY